MRKGPKIVIGILALFVAVLIVLGAQSRELYTEIEITASPQIVWDILTDLDGYEEWNPHIPEVMGEVREGSKLTIRIKEPDGSSMTFEPTVVKVVPHVEFSWFGRFMVPRLFDGEHVFEISQLDSSRIRLVQRESFRGVLVLPLWSMISTDTRDSFEAVNAAIKARAEARVSQEPTD